MDDTLRVFFTYFGGKWRIAPRYPAPTEGMIIEPFAGAAGYSLRYPEHSVRLYDKDPIICGVLDYLIHVKEREILELPEHITDLRDMNLPQEAKYLIGFWLNKGTAKPCNVPGKWMRSSPSSASFWGQDIKKRIASQLCRIRHWTIAQKSFEEIPDIKATWFIDPPYHISGKNYRFSDIDYDRLAEWSKSRTGQVLVCEQDGATWLPFKPFCISQALHGKNGGQESKEVLWSSE